jgi:hypothetical protein
MNPTKKWIELTAEDKEVIRNQYFNTHESEQPTMTSLAAKYNVDRRLIQFILFPEREARHKKQASIRQKEGRYYNKEKAHSLGVGNLNRHRGIRVASLCNRMCNNKEQAGLYRTCFFYF